MTTNVYKLKDVWIFYILFWHHFTVLDIFSNLEIRNIILHVLDVEPRYGHVFIRTPFICCMVWMWGCFVRQQKVWEIYRLNNKFPTFISYYELSVLHDEFLQVYYLKKFQLWIKDWPKYTNIFSLKLLKWPQIQPRYLAFLTMDITTRLITLPLKWPKNL